MSRNPSHIVRSQTTRVAQKHDCAIDDGFDAVVRRIYGHFTEGSPVIIYFPRIDVALSIEWVGYGAEFRQDSDHFGVEGDPWLVSEWGNLE